ncbi:LD-carboxypeptidase [Bacillus sp. M6-12]|uniref:S66 family peptidase n=1 Tax=Bacillus sp. M6-12 TaxID=2054166 RepID=UPI000C76E174|nr:S66 peptidase family protein [Bacillus sp. M6-12]PLS16242.1 LD-carboxypeptidase [Bacillus sp. M6-12]
MKLQHLQAGDEIRVIAPSRSFAILKSEQVEIAQDRLESLGFKVTYGNNTSGHDEFFSSSIEERVQDIHDAFRDPNVKGIFTAIGGYNVNQLLRYLDYDLIKQNPKVLCGFSDITALQWAIYQKTGLITYSGPHFSSFGVKYGFDYTLEYFKKAIMDSEDYEILPSDKWSDDPWYLDQEKREFHEQGPFMVLQPGNAEGEVLAGNLGTLNLLQGTEFMPSIKDCILFIEDDEETHPLTFDRNLQSLLHLPDATSIKALVIGRFQQDSGMTDYALEKIISSKKELEGIPVIANVNFGHVHPFATVPVGGRALVKANGSGVEIKIILS